MVRICKGLYINPLTVAFFIVCYLSGRSWFFVISYVSMFVHELAHLMAAYFIGLTPSHISLHPFGVNLRLKSTIVCNNVDNIILYLSGPCMNLLLALMFITVLRGRLLYDYGFVVNIMLFAVNILPICPLDGGSMVKKVLMSALGEDVASRIMNCISGVISLVVLAVGVYIIHKTEYNYSCIFISVLIFANIFTSKEKYSETALKNIIYENNLQKNKTGKPVRMYVADNEFVPAKYMKYIRPGVFTCVAVLDGSGQIRRIYTEKEIISGRK